MGDDDPSNIARQRRLERKQKLKRKRETLYLRPESSGVRRCRKCVVILLSFILKFIIVLIVLLGDYLKNFNI
jgi:hypothetical protein